MEDTPNLALRAAEVLVLFHFNLQRLYVHSCYSRRLEFVFDIAPRFSFAYLVLNT